MLAAVAAVLILTAPPVDPDPLPRTPAKAPQDVQDRSGPSSATPAASGLDWVAVAACEASGDWSLVTTGNGYYFALQFAPSTWLAYGGTQAELDAGTAPSMARQIEVAERVLSAQGPGAWPNCP